MILNQEQIRRMMSGSGGGAGGAGSLNMDALAGFATQGWTEENYISKAFFNALCVIHKKTTTVVTDDEDQEISRTVDTTGTFAPNELPGETITTDEETGYTTTITTEISSIEAKYGVWTDFFMSALGLNDSGGGGGTTLNEPLASINSAGLGTPTQNGQVITWNGSAWVYAVPSGGGGGGGGTVTSVGLTMPTGFSVANSPITGGGTLAVSFGGDVAANSVLASPNGAAGAPSWRSLVAGDIPSLDASKITTGTFNAARIPDLSNTYATLTAINDMATQTWVGQQGYLTSSDISDMATKTWVNQQGFATQSWVSQNYISIAFFNRIFQAYKSSTISDANKLLPNDVTSAIDNLKIMVGTWTNQYLSALGLNSSGGGGGADMDVVWQALANPTNEQINSSHLTTALNGYATQTWVGQQGYLTSSDINDMATKTWVNQQGFATQSWVSQNYISIAFFNRIFQAYKSSTISDANKLIPNDVTSAIDNLKILVGTWTDQYLSALGLNSSGGGGSLALTDLVDVVISSPTNGQGLTYNETTGKWGNATLFTAMSYANDTLSITISGVTKTVPIQSGISSVDWSDITNKPATATRWPAFSEVTGKPTTLANYGITDAYIQNGTITLGANSITPLTSLPTGGYDDRYMKLSGGTMANTNLVTNMNADLLDGAHGTEFYSLSTNNVTSIQSGDDLNDYTTAGTFNTTGGNQGSSIASSLLNKPTFSGGFRMYVTTADPDGKYIVQRIVTYGGRTFDRFSGSINSSTPWADSVWRELAYTDSNVASATKLADNGEHKVWGQTYWNNGQPISGNITGPMSGVTNISMNGTISGCTNVDSLLYFDTTNSRLGVGTASPSSKLDVNGTINCTSITIGGITLTADNNGIHVNSAGLYADTYVSALGLSSGGGGNATALTDLVDVVVSSPSTGQGLTYNSTTGKWGNATLFTELSYNNDILSITISGVTKTVTIQSGITTVDWSDIANKPATATRWPSFSEVTNHPTTIANYGITDAYIQGNTITLGANSITPITTETDPTVPAWAKQSTKPSYSFSEITGTATAGQIPNLPASKITSGIFDLARIPDLSGTYVTLLNAQTISGVKTFSSQQKFTVTNASPFTVDSSIKVTNLNADLLDGKHLSELFTDVSSTNATNLSITIGGETKTLTYLYAVRLRAVRVLSSNSYGDLNELDGTTYSVITNYLQNSRWLNGPFNSGNYYGGAIVFRGNDDSLMGQLMWNAKTNDETAPTGLLWWRARANKGWYNDWHQIAFTDSNVASATKLEDNGEHKVWGQTYWNNGQPISGNITGPMSGVTNVSMAGNISGCTNIDSMLYFDTTNSRVGVGTSSPSSKLDVNGSINCTSITIGGITLTADNNGIHVNSAGLYADTYVSALGLSSGGGGNATALTDLVDVVVSSPSTGQGLTYNSTTGKWGNATLFTDLSYYNDILSITISGVTKTVTIQSGITTVDWSDITNKPATATRWPAFSEVTGTASTSQIPNLSADKITSGTFGTARIPSLAASKITSGTFDAARIPDMSGTYAAVGRVTTLEGYFTNGVANNANSAARLTTVSKTAWGQTYWTSDGIPDSISGTITVGAGNIVMNNNRYLYWKDTGGTNRDSLRLTSSNNLILGYGTSAGGYDTYVDGTNVSLRYSGHTTGLRLTSSGNIGIGTVSPSYKLHVVGSIYGDSLTMNGSISGCTNIDSLLYLDTTNSRVGIGTASPAYKLHVDGSTGLWTVYVTSGLYMNAGGTGIYLNSDGTGIDWHNSSNSYVSSLLAFSQTQVTVGASNGLRIGNAVLMYDSQNNALKVQHATSGSAMNLYATGGVSALGMSGNSGGEITGNIVPSTDGAYALGSTTKGWNDLYLSNADDSTLNIYVDSGDAWYSCDGVHQFEDPIKVTGTGYFSGKVSIGGTNSNSDKLYVNGSVRASAYNSTSDIRSKAMVRSFHLDVEEVAAAPLFTFRWKADGEGGKLLAGSSAQYWRGVLPEVVTEDADGMLGMDYGVTALASVISVAARVQTHEQRIKALEAENERLRKEIEILKG